MFYNHIVFPGALEPLVDEINKHLETQQSKGSDKSNNVSIDWYGGGYVSEIEENAYYYFKRANQLNFGYDITNVEALRLEQYHIDGSKDLRKECNHFYNNYIDRKLIGILNLNESFNPAERGGAIELFESNRKRNIVDNIFYEKKGSFAVIDVFTGYQISKVSQELKYLFCFCVGPKWQ